MLNAALTHNPNPFVQNAFFQSQSGTQKTTGGTQAKPFPFFPNPMFFGQHTMLAPKIAPKPSGQTTGQPSINPQTSPSKPPQKKEQTSQSNPTPQPTISSIIAQRDNLVKGCNKVTASTKQQILDFLMGKRGILKHFFQFTTFR